jgi:two-component system, OmpR family, phosphate regulon sensor histidine kinase PhoR
MNQRYLITRSLAFAALVAGSLGLFVVVEMLLKWEELEQIAPEALWSDLWVHLAGMLVAAGVGFWVSLLWQKRLGLKVDALVESCRQMALGEIGSLPEQVTKLDELGRLSLAVQFMREALVDYLSLYRRFFDAAPDMFLSLGPAGGIILDANQAFCQNAGLLKSEVLGEPVERFVTLDHGWELSLEKWQELQSGQMRAHHGIIKIEASISLERGPEGQPWVMGAILRDVSQREALHTQLLDKSTALERALAEIRTVEELKDQFLTTLSHELKTPLVSLKGFLQLMLQDRVKEDDRKPYLDICWRNLVKLEKQINDLLDLARLSHAKDQYEMGQVDLADLVRTEAENLRALAGEKRVTLDLRQVPEGACLVRGNPEKLVQLVDNLLVNAVKYNVEGGLVRLSLAAAGPNVALQVSDSGLGIDRESMAKIFNRFYQAEMSGTGRLEGLGIGLSLVQEIVRLHRGDIRVDSMPGVGTTFTVTLEAAA